MNDYRPVTFQTTKWSQVLAARGGSVQAKQTLRELCETYYDPVEGFVRQHLNNHPEARDLTQEFFAKLLEGDSLNGVSQARGRFRSYLLGAIKHFLSDQLDRKSAKKRGSGKVPLQLLDPIDGMVCDVVDPCGSPVDAFFDREWAISTVRIAMTALERECNEQGESRRFEILRAWLTPSQASHLEVEAAKSLEMTAGAFKVAVHRLRKRFRQIVRHQIAASVDCADEIQAELDYLVEALSLVNPMISHNS
jgi:RNA polymerase sigma factor (sigma-70 family)